MIEECPWYEIRDDDPESKYGYCLILSRMIDCFGEYLHCECEKERKKEEKALAEDRKRD